MASEVKAEGDCPSKIRKIDFGDNVTILVGRGEKIFFAHKDALCETSETFRAALSGAWFESKDKIIRLPEHDPVAFSIYLNWRYTSDVDLWDGKADITMRTAADGTQLQLQEPGGRFWRLVDSYVLGDYLKDDLFRNALVDSYVTLSEVTKCKPNALTITLVFELLPETSKLRTLIVHDLAFDIT